MTTAMTAPAGARFLKYRRARFAPLLAQVADPLGYEAGDANLRRYVGNASSNATDSRGLWTWSLGEHGGVLAVSEDGDTLSDLIAQGYDADVVKALGSDKSIDDFELKLPAGISLDISRLLPEPVRAAIFRQQQLEFEGLRERVESMPGDPPDVPQGASVGNSGVNWLQSLQIDEDTGLIISRPYSDNQFGLGNCYGLVGLFLGQLPPKGVTPENFGLSPLESEGFAGGGAEKPGRIDKDWGIHGGLSSYICPDEGLLELLLGDGRETKTPGFGSVAIFKGPEGISHATIVLGRNQAGEVVILQKVNQAAPYGITTTKHPLIAPFGDPIYYSN